MQLNGITLKDSQTNIIQGNSYQEGSQRSITNGSACSKPQHVTGSLDLRFHYLFIMSKNAELFIILLLIFLRLGIFRFDFASLCIA